MVFQELFQAEGLEQLLTFMDHKLDYVIIMAVPDNLIITRLSNRRSCKGCGHVYNLIFEPPTNAGKCDHCNDNLYLREDDNPVTMQNRLNVYHEQTEPLIKYYSLQGINKLIDSRGSIDEIRIEILSKIIS